MIAFLLLAAGYIAGMATLGALILLASAKGVESAERSRVDVEQRRQARAERRLGTHRSPR